MEELKGKLKKGQRRRTRKRKGEKTEYCFVRGVEIQKKRKIQFEVITNHFYLHFLFLFRFSFFLFLKNS